jgi:WS/DGAT C-terminal domain
MVCTNVPGPQYPLYLLGHKLLHCYPYVPVGGEMALNCAVLTYNGSAYFGFSGDVHAAPDLRRFETLLKFSFTELREAAGLRPARKQRKRKENRAEKESKTENKVHTDAQVALTPAPVEPSDPTSSISLEPLVSVEPAAVEPAAVPEQEPSDEEKKVLAELIA